jgi:RNase adaptor protein for sRNA GlmZ degradation
MTHQDSPEIVLISYTTEHPAPAAMLAIDVSNLLAPHPSTDKRLTGLDPKVASEVLDGVGAKRLVDNLLDTAETMLSLFGGRGVVTLAIGSDEGRIRSIALVDELGRQLRECEWQVEVRHRPYRPAPDAAGPRPRVRSGVGAGV